MATVIQIKRGTGTSAPGSLVAGELAVTLGTGSQGDAGDRLFVGDGSNVDVIGGKYFTDMLDQVHGTLTAASAVIVDSNKAVDELLIGNHASNGGAIKLNEGTNNGAHFIALKAPNAVTASTTLTLPDGAGTDGQFLQTDGSDTLAWATVTSSFTLAADSGSNDTFETGQTLTLAGGTGIDSTVSNNQVSFAIDSTVTTLTGSQTLTNKTLTTPSIASLKQSGSNTLTMPAATDTLVGKATTDTLTNKTLTNPIITEIDSGSTITLDATTDIILDADGGDVFFKDGGTTIATLSNTSSDFVITTGVQDKDFVVKGDDGGSAITALTLDMSNAGAATFNSTITATGFVIGSADIGEAELEILDGLTVTTDEVNIIDGDATVGTTAFAAGDGLVHNDDGTMKQTSVATLDTFLSATTKTLTNKTIALGSNTVSGTLAQFQTAVTDATLVDLDDSQTLSNKTLASPVITTQFSIGSAVITEAELEILDGATATTAELNIIDGDTSATSTTLADADRVVVNDNGTMVQVALTDFETYFEGALDTLSNVTTVGALNAGSITSGFGSINNGSSAITTTGNLSGGTVIVGSSDHGTVKSNGDFDLVMQTGNSSTGAITITDGANGAITLNPHGTGTVDMSSARVTSVADPTGDQDAATKAYVDATSNGLDVKASVDVATTADLDYTYSNGSSGVGATLTNSANGVVALDGINLTANMRVLVKDQAGSDADQNGIYKVTTAGADGVALVLTRATDADTAAKLTGGAFTFVEQGSTQQDNGYVFTHDGSPTIGTTNLPVSQFSGAGQITAGTGLTKSGNTINAVGSATIIANSDSLEVNSSGTEHQILRSGGSAGTAATFGQLALNQSAAVTGTLGFANGGTGLTTFGKGSVLVANSADTLTALDGGGSNDGVLFYTASSDTISWATSLDGGTF